VLSAAVLAPTPTGQTYLLYARDDALVAHEFDERTGQVRGSPRVVVDEIGKVANPALRPTVGVSGGVLAFQKSVQFLNQKLTWLDRAGKHVADVSLEVSPNGFSLSPDGSRLVFAAESRGEVDLWVTDLNRNNTLRLTRTPEPERSPVWSPDGSRIAYSKMGKIYVKGVDGLSDETVLANVNGEVRVRDWSADGKYLLYGQAESFGGRLFLWPLMGGAPISFGRRDSALRDGRFSADSRYVAYVSNETGTDEIYIEAVPPTTGRIKVSQGGGTTPRWGSASREVFFYGPDRVLMIVDVQLEPTLSAGVPRRLIPGDALPDRRDLEVSPDGKRFLVRQLAGESGDTPITVVLNWWADLARNAN
jgi:dipeptidyl aminopeptidase/acylaminoacyl peptidase